MAVVALLPWAYQLCCIKIVDIFAIRACPCLNLDIFLAVLVLLDVEGLY